ncbi:MAG: hypothetical protein RR390_12355, partial [Hafnia sp.]
GCRDGVWGALDGRYQTGAEMASRIKSARIEGARWRPSSVAFASGFMETHLLTGERNISPQPHKRQAGGILHNGDISERNISQQSHRIKRDN